MRKFFLLCFVCIVGSIFFTACRLMPEEDVLPNGPVLYSYNEENYETAVVMRGDLMISKSVFCTYIPAREEELSFSLGGIPIDKIYVNKGDKVKAGELLAQLENNNLQEQIAALNYQLKVLETKKAHILENRELDLRKHDIILTDMEWEIEHTEGVRRDEVLKQREEELKKRIETEKEYADQLQAVEDSIYLQGIHIEEIKTDLRERQIFAGIDGTVTYTRKASQGQRSVKGQIFITVSDLDTTVFVVKGEDTQYFFEGQDVVIQCQDRELEAYVGRASDFGLEEPDEAVVYLRLKQPDPTLKDGSSGRIEFILECSEDTLYVDKDAVKLSNGEAFVYIPDEDGMRIMQKVKTGLANGRFVEILDGLQENDAVIID